MVLALLAESTIEWYATVIFGVLGIVATGIGAARIAWKMGQSKARKIDRDDNSAAEEDRRKQERADADLRLQIEQQQLHEREEFIKRNLERIIERLESERRDMLAVHQKAIDDNMKQIVGLADRLHETEKREAICQIRLHNLEEQVASLKGKP